MSGVKEEPFTPGAARPGASPPAAPATVVVRCLKCGAPIDDEAAVEFLTLAEIMARYKIGRTKAKQLRMEARRAYPEAVRMHGRVVRIRAAELDALLADQ